MFNGSFTTLLWYVLAFYLFFLVIGMFVSVFTDILRRENLKAGGKVLWILLIFIVPFLGALIYVIARPKSAQQDRRSAADAKAAQAPTTGGSPLDDIARGQDLVDKGAITQPEFDSIKAKALAK